MSDPATLLPAMTPTLLPLPLDQAVYIGLSTDHYPWTEVTVDLAARQAQGFSAVFDAVQGDRWARFCWARGSLLGGFTRGGKDVTWTATMAALPSARVTLAELPHAVTPVIWASRAATPHPLAGAWPDLRPRLEHELYSGLLVCAQQCSYWAAGRLVGGELPPHGASCVAYSPHGEAQRQALVDFWRELMRAVHGRLPLDDLWPQVLVRLSDDYPCLDPFVREISLQGGDLRVDSGLKVDEFRPALHAALRAVLARAGVRLADLPLGTLRERPEWAAAGLESL